MGRAKSTQIFSFESKKCPCSAFMPENSNCCDEEHELLIVDDSQSQTLSLALSVPAFFQIGEVVTLQSEKIFAYASTQYLYQDFSPPPKEPLFKINCSYVFYEEELS